MCYCALLPIGQAIPALEQPGKRPVVFPGEGLAAVRGLAGSLCRPIRPRLRRLCPTCCSGLRNARFVPVRCLISCYSLPAAKPPRTSWAVRPNGQTIHPLQHLVTNAVTPLSHLVLFPEQLPCPPPSAALEAGLRGPSEDHRGRAGQRMMLQTSGSAPVYVCPCEDDLF